MSGQNPNIFLEVPVGIEPTHRGFADPCLTAWLWYRAKKQEHNITPTHNFQVPKKRQKSKDPPVKEGLFSIHLISPQGQLLTDSPLSLLVLVKKPQFPS